MTQDWTIENFSPLLKLCKPGHCLRSHVFRHPLLLDVSWQLCLYPAGKRDENNGFVSLFLKMTATVPNRELLITAEYKFHFLDDHGQVKFTNVNVGDFHAKPPKGGHSWGLRNIPRPKVVNSLRNDGSLLVHCQIEVLPDPCKMRSVAQRIAPLSEKDLTPVSKTYVNNMLRLLRDGASSSDYKVVAEDDGREFPVHKCILAAHSDVFRAMFEHSDTIESERSTLRIDDFGSDAIGAMLEYIYTGCCSTSSACRPEELLGLADKYNLTYLKSYCEEQLIAKLTKENVCEMLVFADLYRSDSLKQVAMTFVVNFRKEVTNSQSWSMLKEKQPALANDVLEHLLDVAVGDSPPDAKRARMD